jgi:hypothetical protein
MTQMLSTSVTALGSSMAISGKEPRHLELYFYDDDASLEHRY